ncbi:MAG TPA: alpha/beta hydrolase [Firmicutes bacterium]|jgi:pimeloyl-ACP methyl ester carboxylesterase|nr:alpha/beta hydrolase [Bacillota bacterium]
MKLFFKDPLFDMQLQRTLSYMAYQGATIGECLVTAKRIKDADSDSWYAEWLKTAAHVDELAEKSLQAGQFISAREAFLRAANYYRNAAIFLYKTPVDDCLFKAYDRQVTAFKQAAALFSPAFEFVSIPYKDAQAGVSYLPAYFCKVDDTKRPLLILNGGYDSTKEELYFSDVEAALRRGYHCLCFDGPGQGELLIKHHMPFRPDWENVIKWVVDYAVTRPEVDSERMALMGLSFGGYLAPRAVSGEHRISACIADPGQYDLYAAFKLRIPGLLKGFIGTSNPIKNWILQLIFYTMLKRPTKGWALRRGLLVHGATTVNEYAKITKDYTLKGYADKITCPMLVCDTENDVIAAFASKLYENLACPKDYVKFRDADGAGTHCEVSNRALFHQVAFEWLAKVFAGNF